MATVGPRLVNKQFNSPINLYSPQAIQETLDRQAQVLSNGAVGIDFSQLAKPSNLQNSAVLKMLEEEEARKRAGTSDKRVVWPPPPEDQDIEEYIEQGPITAKTRGTGEYASYRSDPSTLQNATPSSAGDYSSTLRQPSQFQQPVTPTKSWAPVTPSVTSPLPQTSPTNFNQQNQERHFANQPGLGFEPPPSLITLRPELPISQESAPVYQAQPAAVLAPSTGEMRGDMKWPPAPVKEQMEAENQARVELARGPVFRPRKVKKDYSGFFAQHALTSTYPGYRAPPGTQYFTPAYHHQQ